MESDRRDRLLADAGAQLRIHAVGGSRFFSRLRAPGYSFTDYYAEWRKIHGAVLNAVPEAHFAGPDIAEEVSWVEQFAQAAPKSVVMLTGLHYAEGPPIDPSVTIGKLLAPDPAFDHHIAAIEDVARKAQMPYVMAPSSFCVLVTSRLLISHHDWFSSRTAAELFVPGP